MRGNRLGQLLRHNPFYYLTLLTEEPGIISTSVKPETTNRKLPNLIKIVSVKLKRIKYYFPYLSRILSGAKMLPLKLHLFL